MHFSDKVHKKCVSVYGGDSDEKKLRKYVSDSNVLNILD